MANIPKHPERLSTYLLLALLSFTTLSLGLLWFISSTTPTPALIAFGAFTLLATAWQAYRAYFCSNDWFRTQEARRSDWWYRHPNARWAMWIPHLAITGYLLWRLFEPGQ